jgi:hypothetical protein
MVCSIDCTLCAGCDSVPPEPDLYLHLHHVPLQVQAGRCLHRYVLYLSVRAFQIVPPHCSWAGDTFKLQCFETGT